MNKQWARILIVDDSSSIRTLLQRILEKYSFECAFAADGREAVDKCSGECFAAILMDLDMPVMNGIRATRTIRRMEEEAGEGYTPIIAVTGQDAVKAERQSREAGMDGFIAKPFTTDDLLQTITAIIGAGPKEGSSHGAVETSAGFSW